MVRRRFGWVLAAIGTIVAPACLAQMALSAIPGARPAADGSVPVAADRSDSLNVADTARALAASRPADQSGVRQRPGAPLFPRIGSRVGARLFPRIGAADKTTATNTAR